MKISKLLLCCIAFSVPYVHAMPDGSFDCSSANSNTSLSFDISNYGEHTIRDVLDLTLNGVDVNLPNKGVQVYRQWVDDSAAKIEVSLPAGNYFSKSLLIQTQSTDGTTYQGTVETRVQDGDYADPVKTIATDSIECTYNP